MAKQTFNEKTWALTFGIFAALVHAVWALAIALTPRGVQAFLTWILALHMLNDPIAVQPFDLTTAATLVIVTFFVGSLFGFVLGKIANFVTKKF